MSSFNAPNKRARPVVSCLRCRDKKLKCDRVDPCENCIKTGHRADCKYNQHPESAPKSKRIQLTPEIVKPPEVKCGIGVLEDVQQRLARVEELLAIQNGSSDLSIQNPWPLNNQPPSPGLQSYLGTLVVKGTRSRYHGQNDRITLLNQFEEAKGFVNQCANDSSIVKLAKEVQFLQSKTQSPLSSPQSISELESFPELLQLLQSLPPRQICDRLVAIYTTNFEKTLRILHVPSFLSKYTHFWAATDHEIDFSSAFIPQLTAVLAISLTLSEDVIKTESHSSWEYLKMNAVGLLQAWLQKLPRKHRIELSTLQIETLILFARQLRLASAEESWKAAGSLVRSAMVMGLHVKVSGSTKMSVFQAEMRRRLWVTVAEMDLQASITSGMPIMTPQFDFQNLSPANLNDSDFEETTIELPPPRPMEEPTDTLALITLAQSISHRIDIMNFAQHKNSTMDLQERITKGQILDESLRNIHPSLKLHRASSNDTTPPILLNQVLLDLYIRRPLLCLYRPINTSNNHDNPHFNLIQRACLDSSLTILSYQDYFDPNLADLHIQNRNEYWNTFHTFCKNDVLWAALSVCKHMKLSTQHTTDLSPNSTTELSTASQAQAQAPLINHSKASLTRLVENTLDSFSRRIGESGNSVKDILLLAVVLQSVRGRGSAETKQRWMMQGANKALSACRQYLLSAVAESSSCLDQTDPMIASTIPSTLPSQLMSSHLQMSDLIDSSSLAADFANFQGFQGDLFSFDEEAFAWNL